MINSQSDEGIQMIEKNVHQELTIDDIPEHIFPTVFRVAQEHYNKQLNASNRLKILSMFYISPTATKTGIWDFFMIFVCYVLMFQISLTLAFGPEFWDQQIKITFAYILAYILLLVCLAIDIVICFHKGYYSFGRGKVIDDHDLIVKHYLKIHFPIDISCLIILIIPLIESQYILNWLQLVPVCLLYVKKFKCQDQIVSMLQYRKQMRIFFILFILMCDVLLIGNFGACIFVGMDLYLWRVQYYGDNTQYYWLYNDSSYSIPLLNGPWILQYVMAQSFSTGTLSTLAPGPFGKNPIQIMYAIILMTFFMLLASYVGQVLISTFYTDDQIRIFHENNIQRFDQFMKLKEVAHKIKDRVYNFFELVWEVEIKMSVERQKQILQKLPTNLKNQLLVEMGFIKQIKFMDYFSTKDGKLVERLSTKINTSIVDADTLLFEQSKRIPMESRCLYYFKDGLAKFYLTIHHQEQILSLSNVQKIIGTYQFLTGQSYHYNCKSIDLSSVQKLYFSDFISILETNKLMENFYKLRYDVLVEEKLSKINKLCVICNEYHTENNCEEIRFGVQVRNQFKNSGGVMSQRRKKYTRKNPNKQKIYRKERKIEFEGKKLLPFIFAKIGGLGNLFSKIKQLSVEVDQLQKYKQYFSEYNI